MFVRGAQGALVRVAWRKSSRGMGRSGESVVPGVSFSVVSSC